jgi:galactose-1-phosphate uridylyltransferase
VDFGSPTVDFGAHDNGVLAAVTLDGERWMFEFSPVLYQFVLSYLTIPANVP